MLRRRSGFDPRVGVLALVHADGVPDRSKTNDDRESRDGNRYVEDRFIGCLFY